MPVDRRTPVIPAHLVREAACALTLVLATGPALANDTCDDLWFTRNLVMDRAGYCFGSPLGKALFDNSNCTGKSVKLSQSAGRLVAALKAQEQDYACKVDTKRTAMTLNDMTVRRKLVDLPVAVAEESGCIGWEEPVTALHAGRDAATPETGKIQPGDHVLFGHWDQLSESSDWSYVQVFGPDWQVYKAAGWLRTGDASPKCTQWAG